jgi:hypothetical protein
MEHLMLAMEKAAHEVAESRGLGITAGDVRAMMQAAQEAAVREIQGAVDADRSFRGKMAKKVLGNLLAQ